MIREDMNPGDIERKVHDLAKAMNDIRSSQADLEDQYADAKFAKLSRLELLVEELKPVIADIPKDCDRFEFAISRGETPRLWVDMTTFVRLAGDGREYELVKDTRKGRIVLGRDVSRTNMGNRITSYVAENLLDRERMIEGDWVTSSHSVQPLKEENQLSEQSTSQTKTHRPGFVAGVWDELSSKVEANSNSTQGKFMNESKHSSLTLFMWFIMGFLIGGAILVVLTWLGLIDKIVLGLRP